MATLLPSDAIVLSSEPTRLTIAVDSTIKVNGNKVYFEAVLAQDGQFTASVGGKSIHLPFASISLSRASVCAACSFLKTIQLCEGVHLSEIPSHYRDTVYNVEDTAGRNVYFHMQCMKVCGINISKTHGKICDICRGMQWAVDRAQVSIASACSSAHQIQTNNKSPSTDSEPDKENVPQFNRADTTCLSTPARNSYQNTATISSEAECNHINEETTETFARMSIEPSATPTGATKLISLLQTQASYLSSQQLNLISSQLLNTKSNLSSRKGNRWDVFLIQTCLSIWNRSPRAYEQLLASGCVSFPCTKTLQRYKNSVTQCAGVNKDVLKWMFLEAKQRELAPHAYYGGLIFDEMSIQEDVQIVRKRTGSDLVGFVDVGPEPSVFSSDKKSEAKLANHVLQFMFLGLTGFRFLVAHYPTVQANAAQIYSMFWDVVTALEEWGFHTLYTCFDGASNNRSFLKMHFPQDPLLTRMVVPSPISQNPIIFLSDPSHLFKKIRNNILSSGNEKWHTRCLTWKGNVITWKMWIDCYNWDKLHSLPIHYKLSNEHIHPNSAEKMRNHLADDVLDSEMLHLFQRYQQTLSQSNHALDGAVALLQQTSVLIKVFKDRRPIRSTSDERLHKLSAIKQWFSEWEMSCGNKELMSYETREDLQFLCHGFPKLCELSLDTASYPIVPAYVNSDIVENNFCQQRGLHHGAGSNPNYRQYCIASNSITLGQETISKKANASKRHASSGTGALPFKQLCKKFRI